MAYGGVRAALLHAIEARTDTIIAAYDRGLASADDRVAMTAADTLLDRYLGRPTAVTETQPPGTQAYVELRRTLDLLPPEERLDYLREARMAAAIAATPQLPVQEAERAVNSRPRTTCAGAGGGGARGVGEVAEPADAGHRSRGRREELARHNVRLRHLVRLRRSRRNGRTSPRRTPIELRGDRLPARVCRNIPRRYGSLNEIFNLYGDPEWDRTEDREGWRIKDAWVGYHVGAELIGGSMYEVEPGDKQGRTTRTTRTRSG